MVVILGNCEEIKPAIREITGAPAAAQIRHVLRSAPSRCRQLFEQWRKIHGY